MALVDLLPRPRRRAGWQEALTVSAWLGLKWKPLASWCQSLGRVRALCLQTPISVCDMYCANMPFTLDMSSACLSSLVGL